MHFPVMIISEKPLDWDEICDLLGPYTENSDDPMYEEDHDHKYDYWGQGGRYDWMLGGEVNCRLEDFPMIRPDDTEKVLKQKCPVFGKHGRKTHRVRPARNASEHGTASVWYCRMAPGWNPGKTPGGSDRMSNMRKISTGSLNSARSWTVTHETGTSISWTAISDYSHIRTVHPADMNLSVNTES